MSSKRKRLYKNLVVTCSANTLIFHDRKTGKSGKATERPQNSPQLTAVIQRAATNTETATADSSATLATTTATNDNPKRTARTI